VSPRNAEGPDTDARPNLERQVHTTEGNSAFACDPSADATGQRGTGGPVPAGQLPVPVMRELFARADALEDGEE